MNHIPNVMVAHIHRFPEQDNVHFEGSKLWECEALEFPTYTEVKAATLGCSYQWLGEGSMLVFTLLNVLCQPGQRKYVLQ